MARKRHNGFIYQRIVVFVFIFLNCLFTAAPFVQASAFNSHAINVSAFSLQNQNDEEETSHLSNIADEQQDCHITFRNKISNAFYSVKDYRSDAGIEKDSAILHFADTYLLIRPQYYSFLSIYYLF
ncbi:MAG: hypothetical protein ACTHOB_05550 [Ginsengibacter sp.]